MSKKTSRPYSAYTREALRLLATQIKATRLERRITTTELAERAGISRGLLHRVENGDPACSIGVAFEVATLLGLRLFQSEDYAEIALRTRMIEEKLALLPRHAHARKIEISNDF